jgi:penicillin-binding protein 3
VPIKKLPISERPLALEIIELPGLYSKRVEARQYPYGKAAAHLTGYIGKINAEKLEKLKGEGYTAQSLLGISGAEEVYEEKLRGQSGQRIYLTKESGEEVMIAEQEVKNGDNVTLTVDAEMQKKLYEQMKDEVGTAAAVDPETGEALALVSVPSYDPNEFSLGIAPDKYDKIYNNPDKPLRNRFYQTYSPGSAMKGITAAVGLKSGKLDPNKTFEIKGKRWQKDNSWGGYEVVRVFDNDSVVDLESAMKFSDNIYFARVGLEMGAETFIQGLKDFGYGEEIPMSYPIEKSQVSNDGKITKEIQLADSAFGQGEVLMSVVHLASAYGGIINDGTMMKPVLLKDEEQGVWKESLLSPKQSQLMRTNLRKVVTEGIAGKAQAAGKEIAGKTGTAEIKAEQGTTGKENGLFVSYDQKNPEFILAMLLEGVEERGGSTHTVEVAKKFYDSY